MENALRIIMRWFKTIIVFMVFWIISIVMSMEVQGNSNGIPEKMFQGDSVEFSVGGGYSFSITDTSIIDVNNGELKALKPGTATVTVKNTKGIATVEKTVTVISRDGAIITANIVDKDPNVHDQFYNVIPKKSTIVLPATKSILVDNYCEIESITMSKDGLSKEISSYDISSNNNSLIPSPDKFFIYPKHSGKCRVTIKADNWFSTYIDFNITAKTIIPKMKPQVEIRIGGEPIRVYHNTIGVEIVGEKKVVSYELYRSQSPKSGFKKIATIEATSKTQYYDSNGLKPNTQYFYKARAKLTNQEEYGPFSEPVSYWTAPKEVAKKKITFKKKTRRAKWKKVKGVAGYIVVARYFEFEGYNVFGQRVYYKAKKSTFTKKTKLKIKKHIGMKPSSIYKIYPCAKHSGYYYMNGKKLTKSRNKLKISEGDKVVS